ncbi:S1 family peptidase [Actinokineospora guangxiensis]|uniref:S1 family peptidase n=1 Tax=Actinokineospora guangxiensis TaxID=1490288 RepID=A0ABW0EVA2_9PSEU
MRRAPSIRIAVIGALAMAVTAVLPAQAATVQVTENAPQVSTAMAKALQRDLGLSAEEVRSRLAAEEKARTAEKTAAGLLGSTYAGSWFDPASNRLIAQTTDPAKAEALAGHDFQVRTVRHSSAALDSAKTGIDSMAGKNAPAAVNGWYVDVRTNSVVITVNRHKLDTAAKEFVGAAADLHPSVRVVEEEHSPQPLADVVGGWPYYINFAGRCSVGFAVHGGFVTAGHCGGVGATASDSNGAVLGSFAGSTFPYYDYGWVRTNAGVNLHGYVEGYDGYWYYVRGSAQAAVNSGICRSGSTTGMWCGTIVARGQTVNYPQGIVYNLTRTTVCAEPGDSGGSWLSANQAQGVTSGGSGNCSSGGVTFYQEVNPILSAYGLSLILT